MKWSRTHSAQQMHTIQFYQLHLNNKVSAFCEENLLRTGENKIKLKLCLQPTHYRLCSCRYGQPSCYAVSQNSSEELLRTMEMQSTPKWNTQISSAVRRRQFRSSKAFYLLTMDATSTIGYAFNGIQRNIQTQTETREKQMAIEMENGARTAGQKR